MFTTMALSGCGLALIPKANQRNKAMFQRSSPLFVSRALCSRCSRSLCKRWHRLLQTFSAYFLRWPLRFLLEPHSVFPCFWLTCWQARGKFPHRMTSVLQCLARPPMFAFYRQWAVSDRKLLIASQLLQLVSYNPIQTHRTQSHYTHTHTHLLSHCSLCTSCCEIEEFFLYVSHSYMLAVICSSEQFVIML